jgi:hypothetical protein
MRPRPWGLPEIGATPPRPTTIGAGGRGRAAKRLLDRLWLLRHRMGEAPTVGSPASDRLPSDSVQLALGIIRRRQQSDRLAS